MDNRPIGIFDSGLGGLTVFKEIAEQLPHESLVYFGDSGRAPYGTKSRETVIKYTLQNIRFLLTHDIKMVVIACNTMSAHGYEFVSKNHDLPIIEVIGAGAMAAVAETRNKKIGVIGTPLTISSGVYQKAINKLITASRYIRRPVPFLSRLLKKDKSGGRMISPTALQRSISHR